MTGIRATWYSREGSRAAEIVTVLHPPYTVLFLAMVTIASSLASTLHWDRLLLTIIAYSAGLGVGAHSLDQVGKKRWYVSRLSSKFLWSLGLSGLSLGAAIGIYLSLLYSPPFLAFVLIGLFSALAYNLELFRGRFHNDLFFSISWGFLPALSSYYIQALTLTVASVVVAAGLAFVAFQEITLSRYVRSFRRGESTHVLSDPRHVGEVISRPERALKVLVIMMVLLAGGLLAVRIFPY